MNLRSLRRGATATAAVLALSASLAACGSDDDEAADAPAASASSSADEGSSDEGSEEAAGAGDQVFGPACDAVPTDGAGSFDGMVQDPVATAASNNPLLTTLVAAVGAVDGLGDTLNGADALTVFAPYDDAFAAIPEKALNGLLEGAAQDGTDSDLATVLSHHVVGGQLDPSAVVGEQETLAGDTITIEGDESGMTVTDGTATATVLCGNIPTANATVYVIDTVLTGPLG